MSSLWLSDREARVLRAVTVVWTSWEALGILYRSFIRRKSGNAQSLSTAEQPAETAEQMPPNQVVDLHAEGAAAGAG